MSKIYISVDFKRIYFTAACSRFCQLTTGQHITFFNEGDTWHFCKTEEDDFTLTPVIAKGVFHITSAGLCGMMLRSMGHWKMKKLAVVITKQAVNGFPLYNISQAVIKRTSRPA